jgi:hypothetical protein
MHPTSGGGNESLRAVNGADFSKQGLASVIIYLVSIFVLVSHAAETLALNLHGQRNDFPSWSGCVFALGSHGRTISSFHKTVEREVVRSPGFTSMLFWTYRLHM